MKKITFILSALFLTVFLSCDTESINEEPEQAANSNPNFRVASTSGKGMFSRASYDEPCMTTNLIAGQNDIAGTVSVDNDGENLIITYSTNGDWTIDLTHLSIGGCEEQWVPTTGSGNPKIGQFEHSEPHADGTTEVVYLISLDALTENYCFAAHAEVQGATGGETAWAEGPGFDGNSWAMYVEALLSDCDVAAADEEEEPPVK
ncbi:hypothetical protein A9Q86_14080 [Flavobacteriales bacterium 33_180_T64]|nr:hypothetical protein A9Q86_14080 [Flavobacteriales bacterium 33_180_T64]